MDIKELRIGNLVWDDYSGVMIVSEIKYSIESVLLRKSWTLPDGSYKVKDIQPIPLTDDKLTDFGFDVTDEGAGFMALHFWKDLGRDRMYLRHFFMGGYIWGFNNFEEINQPIAIESIHQLQNLYFALTGKELETN